MIDLPPEVTPAAINLLQEQGFEVVHSGLVEDTSTWLRDLSHGSRQIMITLPKNASSTDVIDAIFDAGLREKRGYFKKLFKAITQGLETDDLNLKP